MTTIDRLALLVGFLTAGFAVEDAFQRAGLTIQRDEWDTPFLHAPSGRVTNSAFWVTSPRDILNEACEIMLGED